MRELTDYDTAIITGSDLCMVALYAGSGAVCGLAIGAIVGGIVEKYVPEQPGLFYAFSIIGTIAGLGFGGYLGNSYLIDY